MENNKVLSLRQDQRLKARIQIGNHSRLWIAVVIFCACSSVHKKESTSDQFNWKYIEEMKLFQKVKFSNNYANEDTVWYYKSKKDKFPILMTTIIKKGNTNKLNQSITYNKTNEIDSVESYYYKIITSKDSLYLKVNSPYCDSMYFIVGFLNDTYDVIGKTDTIPINTKPKAIKMKDYYKRGRIGMFKVDSNMFLGKELLVPQSRISTD